MLSPSFVWPGDGVSHLNNHTYILSLGENLSDDLFSPCLPNQRIGTKKSCLATDADRHTHLLPKMLPSNEKIDMYRTDKERLAR